MDDAAYLIGTTRKFPGWDDLFPASSKRVAQYPPGTGLMLGCFRLDRRAQEVYNAVKWTVSRKGHIRCKSFLELPDLPSPL